MTSPFTSFGIIGAGAWGTALAVSLHRAGRKVVLSARSAELATAIADERENAAYLPGIKLDPAIIVSADKAALSSCQAVILAVPSQFARQICKNFASHLPPTAPVIIAAKGIELTTHRLMSEVVAQELPDRAIFILSGPSFAGEVARDLPTALTLASETGGEALARAISTQNLRLYTSDDIIGTQIGGAIKNVLAIACGIVGGRQMGDNARAALITRGLAEMVRLGIALGARAETLMGLSGLGDAVLTCSSPQSRNMALGIALGQGKHITDIMAAHHGVAEGVATAAATLGLAHRHGVDMPVVRAVDMIVREHANIDTVISALLSRPLRQEAA